MQPYVWPMLVHDLILPLATLSVLGWLYLLLGRDGSSEEIHVPGEDRFLLEIEDLCAAVRSGRPPRMSLADSRANVAALVAFQRSAQEGRPVRLGGA